MTGPRARLLADGRRLHLQHGPIDLVIDATGRARDVGAAYRAAESRFATVLSELCDELASLRRPVSEAPCRLDGRIARAMDAAVRPFAGGTFITPMAAVAGAVADDILEAMTGTATLDRASVNNGGDISIHLADGQSVRIGLVDRPDIPGLYGTTTIGSRDAVRGIATSGWRGRSFSLGIADSVTILAPTAAQADAAATIVANAVDCPGHPAVARVPACAIQVDSDLGARLVTRNVGRLARSDIQDALTAGLVAAQGLIERDLIRGCAIHLQGVTATAGGLDEARSARPLLRTRAIVPLGAIVRGDRTVERIAGTGRAA